MQLFSVVLVVEMPTHPTEYCYVTVRPMRMGFDWRGKAPKMEPARDLPALSLQISTHNYSNEVSQTHYDAIKQGEETEYIENLQQKVDCIRAYNKIKEQLAEQGLENPVKSLQAFYESLPITPIGFLLALDDGQYEPVTAREIIDKYRRLAHDAWIKQQTRLDEQRRKEWEDHMGEITKASIAAKDAEIAQLEKHVANLLD